MKTRFFSAGLAAALILALGGASVFAQETTAPSEGKTGFFIQVQGGLSFFLKNTLSVEQSIEFYGETGSLAESYTFGTAVPLSVYAGKYLKLGGLKLKAGLGADLLVRGDSGSFTAAIPHPFEFNKPRTVDFTTEDMGNSTFSITAFGLFKLVETEKVGLWLGPIIGLGFESISTLGDFVVNEKSPYTSAVTSVSDITLTADSFTSLWYGAKLDFEYAISPRVWLVGSGRLVYDNPVLPNIGNRANFLQVQAAAGIQIIL